MYGYICPPSTGNYIFWIASDASAELWLSTTGSPANKVKIAYNTSSTNSRQWTKYATQKSVSISLTTGQLCEALMKETLGQTSCCWMVQARVPPTASEYPELPENNQWCAGTYLPTNLSASSISQTGLFLRWTGSTDNIAVTGYDVYKNGTRSTVQILPVRVMLFPGFPATAFFVIARDAAGNQSAPGGSINNHLVPGTHRIFPCVQ